MYNGHFVINNTILDTNNIKVSTSNKYYYLYKIINNINNKFYYGVHTSDDLEKDKYAGSGIALYKAYHKYGIDNFTKYIIEFFESEDEMYAREREIVNADLINNKQCYNTCTGGKGGRKDTLIVKDKDGNTLVVSNKDERYLSGELVSINAGNTNPMYGKHHTNEYKQLMSNKIRQYCKENPRTRTQEAINKQRLKMIGRKKIHLNNLEKNVYQEELQSYLDAGWILGSRPRK